MPKAARKTSTSKAKKPAEIDPFIAALATLKRLDRKWFNSAAAFDRAEKTGPKAWVDAQSLTENDVEEASDQALAAAWKMARTEPTTTAGAAAMLRFLTRDEMYGVWQAWHWGKAAWLETAFRTLERSLAKMARGIAPTHGTRAA